MLRFYCTIYVLFQVFQTLLDAIVLVQAKTPSFEIPFTNITLKKDSGPEDNLIESRINIDKILKKEVDQISDQTD